MDSYIPTSQYDRIKSYFKYTGTEFYIANIPNGFYPTKMRLTENSYENFIILRFDLYKGVVASLETGKEYEILFSKMDDREICQFADILS